jgi:magnesium transporter
MKRETLAASLREALEAPDAATLDELAGEHHPADIAAVAAGFDEADRLRLLQRLSPPERAAAFSYLDAPLQLAAARSLARGALAETIAELAPDERVDFFNRLPPAVASSLTPALVHAEREDLRRLRAYPEGTVGAVMTSDYAVLMLAQTTGEAIESLRTQAPDRETIYQAYVVDGERRLVGTLSLRELLLAPASARVGEVMIEDVIAVAADEPRSVAAARIAEYDLIALPVIDDSWRLVGIVTYDDAMDVAEDEATEDFHKAGGTLGDLGPSFRTAPILQLYRKRVFWLVLLVFGNVFSGAGIARFEDTIAAYVGLVFFLPLLIGSSGNAGAQSATLMVRAMATGDVHVRDWGQLLLRELFVAGLLGATMAFAVSGIGLVRGGPQIAAIVAGTMVTVVVVGSLIGLLLPLALNRLRLDPATASAPLVTSIADAAGVVIYLSIATHVLVT